MNPVARARHVLARRPWLYWSAVLVLAAGAGWAVTAAAAGVDDARRAWGTSRDVLVATVDIAPGDDARRRAPRCGPDRSPVIPTPRRHAAAGGDGPPAHRRR